MRLTDPAKRGPARDAQVIVTSATFAMLVALELAGLWALLPVGKLWRTTLVVLLSPACAVMLATLPWRDGPDNEWSIAPALWAAIAVPVSGWLLAPLLVLAAFALEPFARLYEWLFLRQEPRRPLPPSVYRRREGRREGDGAQEPANPEALAMDDNACRVGQWIERRVREAEAVDPSIAALTQWMQDTSEAVQRADAEALPAALRAEAAAMWAIIDHCRRV